MVILLLSICIILWLIGMITKQKFLYRSSVVLLVLLLLASYAGTTKKRGYGTEQFDPEAKSTLDFIRTWWTRYKLEHKSPPSSLKEFQEETGMEVSCQPMLHYFSYRLEGAQAIATRCTHGGKEPNAKKGYSIILDMEKGGFHRVE